LWTHEQNAERARPTTSGPTIYLPVTLSSWNSDMEADVVCGSDEFQAQQRMKRHDASRYKQFGHTQNGCLSRTMKSQRASDIVCPRQMNLHNRPRLRLTHTKVHVRTPWSLLQTKCSTKAIPVAVSFVYHTRISPKSGIWCTTPRPAPDCLEPVIIQSGAAWNLTFLHSMESLQNVVTRETISCLQLAWTFHVEHLLAISLKLHQPPTHQTVHLL